MPESSTATAREERVKPEARVPANWQMRNAIGLQNAACCVRAFGSIRERSLRVGVGFACGDNATSVGRQRSGSPGGHPTRGSTVRVTSVPLPPTRAGAPAARREARRAPTGRKTGSASGERGTTGSRLKTRQLKFRCSLVRFIIINNYDQETGISIARVFKIQLSK